MAARASPVKPVAAAGRSYEGSFTGTCMGPDAREHGVDARARGGARLRPFQLPAGSAMNAPTSSPPFARSLDERMIAGVMGGIARRFGWNATLVRAVFVIVSVASAAFPGILVYLLLWLLMPNEA